jgi:hypothetical protein
VQHGSQIDIDLDGQDPDDLDLYLYVDANKDGTFETQIASSGSSGPDEHIHVQSPADGHYAVLVHGYAVPAQTARFNLNMVAIQGVSVTAKDLPGPGSTITAGKPVEFQICFTLPPAAAGHYRGEFIFGPAKAPALIHLPVEVWTR